MTTIANAYINALLADAAYVDLANEPLDSPTNRRVLGDLLTPTLAAYLAANFEVASAINSSDNPLTGGSGFDATVWRGKAGGDYAGQIFVSTRGTEPGAGGADLLADGDLALATGARSQIADMVNWWLKITTPVGKSARQIWLEPVYDNSTPPVEIGTHFAMAANVPGLGLLSPAELAQGVQVEGHSLGGHLATAFARVFGANNGITGSVNVQSLSTFNSAGFNGSLAETLFRDIQALLGTGSSSFAPVSAKQTNFFAQNGINVTTNDWWFTQMGTRTGLYQEETTGIGNHSMYRLTDLLALGAALEKLDSSFTLDKLNALSKVGSNDPKGSLEGVLDSLRRALAGPNVEQLPISDAGDSDTSRITFHATLAALQANPIFKELTGQLVIRPSSADLRADVRNDFGALIALQDLSPLYISGATAEANSQLTEIWQAGRAADHAAWTADKTAATPSHFTDNWITDRAALLQAIVTRNKQDNGTNAVFDASARADQVTFFDFYDAANTPTVLSTQNAGVTGLKEQHILFGNDAANTLSGFDNVLGDHLYGGAGADTLDGKGGADYLEGGQGNDTYQFSGNFGNYTIVDTDGLGSIRIAPGLWESEDKGLVYLLQGGDLIIGQRTAPATRDKPINPESIARSDHSTGANGQFDTKTHAVNDVGWRLAA